MSGLVPGAKVSVVVAWPESSDVDARYIRLLSPFICCSITCTTVFSTVCAEAPGYCAVIWIDGGAIVGYCSIGIETIDNPPASMARSAMTIAKIGRSMKNLAMADLWLISRRRRPHSQWAEPML